MAKFIVVHSVKVATEFVPETFGRLTTIGPRFQIPYGRQGQYKACQVCHCSCGAVVMVPIGSLRAADGTKSCGCLRRETTVANANYERKPRGPYKRNKLAFGVGMVDAPYVVKHTNKIACPYYQVWRSMLTRCYCPKFHKNHPTYIGCKVAEEWHSFLKFRTWMETKDWADKELDKDFLSDSGVYGPDICVFVPGWLNVLFSKHRKASDLPMGVTKGQYGGYQSRLGMYGKRVRLGSFATPEAAHAAYVTAKTDYVRSRYPEIALIDPRLVEACERKLKQLTDKIPPVEAT